MFDSGAFPVYTHTDVYKYFTNNTLDCHWHNEFEYGYVLEGSIDFYVNNTPIKLKKGDCFFVNSNVLHMGKQTGGGKDAVARMLRFPAALLAPDMSGDVYSKYIAPLLNGNMPVEGFGISKEKPNGQALHDTLTEIFETSSADFGYELIIQRNLNRLWLLTLKYIEDNKGDIRYGTEDIRYGERIKGILSYIYEHYSEDITADDIAKHMNISRGECFRCFKRFMNKRLIHYINEYRLQKAAALLRQTEMSVAEIAVECGFYNISYFGKTFKDIYKVTPLQYRKAYIWTDNAISRINGYDYEYWKDTGNGTMTITTSADNGSFLCMWSNIGNILFRSGKKFINRDKTHAQMGDITLLFDAAYNSNGMSYLSVYGWTVDPLVEYYIVEDYMAHNPMRNETILGTHNTDGGTYKIYYCKREAQPSIVGTSDFDQYWSIRTTGRLSGKMNLSNHFRAWEDAGLTLGRLAEIALSVESMQSSGSAIIRKNVIRVR